MSILSDFEDRLASVVDGAFAGVFRSPVQPVEIAKSLGSAMDDKRTVGVSKVYAPTQYAISISADDAEEMGSFRDTLAGELTTFIVARAQEKQYHLASHPKVEFAVDERLKLGRFKVTAQMAAATTTPTAKPESSPTPPPANDDLAARIPEVRPEQEPPAAPVSAAAIAVGTGTPTPPDTTSDSAPSGVHALATVTVTGIDHDVALTGDRMGIGRLSGCDICLQDVNVSREHAAFVADGDGWAIEDLGSTNGTTLNGEPVKLMRLTDGDVIQVGVSQLIYHEPRV